MREFHFEAKDRSNRTVRDTLVAVDAADARAQLARMGYSEAQVRADNLAFVRQEGQRSELPGLMIDADYDPLALVVLKIFARHWMLMLPGLFAMLLALWLGVPSIWWGVALVGAAALFTLRGALPAMLFNLMQSARLHGHYDIGLHYANAFRMLALDKLVAPLMQDAERARMLAGLGRLDEALAVMSLYEDDSDPLQYLPLLASVYDIAGERELMAATQRKLVAASGNSLENRIDLAYTLARHTDRYEEVRGLIDGAHPDSCSDLYACVLRTVQGILLQSEGQHKLALAKLRKAHHGMMRHTNPAIVWMRDEMQAYVAVSMKALGKKVEGKAIWKSVLPMLRVHHCYRVIAAYDKIF